MKRIENHSALLAALIGLIVLCTPAVDAQQNGHIAIAAQDLETGDNQGEYEGIPLYYNWRFHPGDDMAWADARLDDSDWEIAPDTRLFPGALPQSGWPGIGWFRLHLSVAPELRGLPLALRLYNAGAAEIYLDGQMIDQFGTVGASEAEEKPYWDSNPQVMHLDNRPRHLLAVRYSGHVIMPAQNLDIPIGFGLVLGDLNRSIADKVARVRKATGYQMFFSGAPIAVALVHLFLFAFYPRARENFFFSLFAASFAAYVFVNFRGHFLTDAPLYPAILHMGRVSSEIVDLARLWHATILLMGVSGIRFLYAMFYKQRPRQFFFFLIAGIVLGIWSWVRPFQLWMAFNGFSLLMVGEMVRVVVLALIRKKYGARIIGVGTASILLGATYLLLRNLGMEGIPLLSMSFYFGSLILFFSMSVQLARNFTAVRRGLEQQLETVHDLSQINAELRQSRAIEQVRAEATAMRESLDIVNVVAKLWQGLETCELEFEAIGIAVTEPGRRRLQFYAAAEISGDLAGLLPDPARRLFAPGVAPGVNLWRNDVPLSHALSLRPHPGLHAVDAHFENYLDKIWNIKDPDRILEGRPIIEAAFHHGYMGLLARRNRPFIASHYQIVERFVQALSLGYTRYFDLQKLEGQNRALEEANREVQRANQAKSAFLANISHEIRTPINAILGYAQILQRNEDLPAEYRPAIETIQNNGDHLLNLINDVLELSKIEADHMELTPTDFDLTNLLRNLGTIFSVRCAQKGIAWQLEWEKSDPLWVRGDSAKLTQVLINLLDNAAKFTEIGSVALHVAPQCPEIHAAKSTEAHGYVFDVSDTGPGISEADRSHMFEAFQQGSAGIYHGGTGLGLAIARRHVELMGGVLNVASTPGQGTRFSFTLTLPEGREGTPETEAWSRVRHLAPGHHVKALIADDIAESRAILAHALEEIGAEVDIAVHGREVLNRLETTTPDIIFLDIRMPVLNGLETLKHMQSRSEWRAIKTVAVSASSFDIERKRVLAAGFDAFIAKPYRFEAIYACLHELLGVAFTYTDTEAQSPEPETGAWRDLALPADLFDRIREAAEFRRVTHLEACFKEIEALGAPRLAAHLRTLRRRHDMDAILTLLESMRYG